MKLVESNAHYGLAVMATAGVCETSGDWLCDIDLLGTSGIGIPTVGTFASTLDSAGNSVKRQLVAKFLSQGLGLDLLVSKPEV